MFSIQTTNLVSTSASSKFLCEQSSTKLLRSVESRVKGHTPSWQNEFLIGARIEVVAGQEFLLYSKKHYRPIR